MGAGSSDGLGAFRTWGHAAALTSVAVAVRAERPPHAVLIVGPRGVGKTTLALDLAAGLLCLVDDPAARPCRACPACHKIEVGVHPDVHILAPEGAGEQIRLGQVQALSTDLALTPLEGRFRIAIIASAQRLNPDAQNALLKTLEEPGVRTCLVLCADDSAPLLPTLLSRTARLRLTTPAIEPLATWLVRGGHADPATARTAAIAAAGRPGIALALTRQPQAMLARAGISRTLLSLLSADRRARLASAGELLSAGLVVDAATRGEVAAPAARLQPVERRRAMAALVDAWRDLGRDLAVAMRGDGRAVRDLDLLPELLEAAAGAEASVLLRFLDRLDRLALAVEEYASPELVLDSLLLTWPRKQQRSEASSA